MIKTKSILAAVALVAGLARRRPWRRKATRRREIQKQSWTLCRHLRHLRQQPAAARLPGLPAKSARAAIRRSLLAFRNLTEAGRARASREEQVKALRPSTSHRSGRRGRHAPGHRRRPLAGAVRRPTQDARDANGGVAAAGLLGDRQGPRRSTQPFPWWILNYFTGYSGRRPGLHPRAAQRLSRGSPPAANRRSVRAARGQVSTTTCSRAMPSAWRRRSPTVR